MKKILSTFILITFLYVSIVFAQGLSEPDIWYLEGNTVAWDPIILLSNGSPIPIADTVTYNIYIVKWNQNAVDAVLVDNTALTQYTPVIAPEGKYFIGVSGVRTPAGQVETFESPISWTINPGRCASNITFGIISYLVPGTPGEILYS